MLNNHIPTPADKNAPHNTVGSFAEIRNGRSLFVFESGVNTITHVSLTYEMAQYLIGQLEDAFNERRVAKKDRRRSA